MTKDVLITISGLQMLDDGGQEPVEVITGGAYYYRNNKHYIQYEEIMEGFEGITKNLIKINENSLSISKKGVSNVEMVFEMDKKNVTCYETPLGALMVGITANKIQVLEIENAISVDVDYALDINYEHLADCNIKMEIRSKKSKDFKICS
ncbi:MAG: DUF1934 domain-containing protein [Lachnospiraceae bacterium]